MAIDLSTIEIIDITPNVNGYGQGNTVTFTVGPDDDAGLYHFQQWFTDNSNGTDFYDANYEIADPIDDDGDDLEVLQTFLEKVLTDYEQRFDASINPLIQQLVAQVINDAEQHIPEEA